MSEIIGLDKLINNLKLIDKKVQQIASKELCDAALDLWNKSVEQAPVDTGDLRGSASVTVNNRTIAANKASSGPINVNSDKIEAIVGYNEPYALKQHEHLEYRHPQGGNAKYLENPYKQNINKYIDGIANGIKSALK